MCKNEIRFVIVIWGFRKTNERLQVLFFLLLYNKLRGNYIKVMQCFIIDFDKFLLVEMLPVVQFAIITFILTKLDFVKA